VTRAITRHERHNGEDPVIERRQVTRREPSTAQHRTAQHSTAQHSTAQHADGEIWYVVAADDEVHAQVAKSPRADVVLVLPARSMQLRDAVLDVAAYELLQRDVDIMRDRVAAREVRLRLSEVQQSLHELITANYGPGHGRWYVHGQLVDVRDQRQFDATISQLFDVYYAEAPRIRSELIVRRKISGTVARARRQLIELLLEQSQRPQLGLTDGYPPERALYESILRAGRIHQPAIDGDWHLQIPAADADPLHLRPVLAAIDAFFDTSISQRRPLIELYQLLQVAPYGVREPLLPLLFVVMYIIRSGEIVLYEHDSFVAVPDTALFERLVAKPHHFAVRRMPQSGLRVALFERVAKAFAPQALSQRGNLAVLDAVKPMLRFVQQLPAYVRQTAHVSPTTAAVRAALIAAKAPDDLLYVQLPQALGMPVIAGDAPLDDVVVEQFARGLRTALEELQQAFPKLQTACLSALSQAVLATTSDSALLHAELQDRMQLVVHESADPQLRAFANRILAADAQRWFDPVAALLGRKPMMSWSDADVGVYHVAVADIGRRLRLLEQVATAQQQHYLGHERRRVGISDARGERSAVITLTSDTQHHALKQQVDALFGQAGLDTSQRLSLLVRLMDELLPREDADDNT